MIKYWTLDASAVPDSQDGGVLFQDRESASSIAEQISQRNDGAVISVIDPE